MESESTHDQTVPVQPATNGVAAHGAGDGGGGFMPGIPEVPARLQWPNEAPSCPQDYLSPLDVAALDKKKRKWSGLPCSSTLQAAGLAAVQAETPEPGDTPVAVNSTRQQASLPPVLLPQWSGSLTGRDR